MWCCPGPACCGGHLEARRLAGDDAQPGGAAACRSDCACLPACASLPLVAPAPPPPRPPPAPTCCSPSSMSALLTRNTTFLRHLRMYCRKVTSLSLKGRSADMTNSTCAGAAGRGGGVGPQRSARLPATALHLRLSTQQICQHQHGPAW
jgi:hypothetical protein